MGLIAGFPAMAYAQEGERIVAVRVHGARTIADETILARVQTKAGSPYQDRIATEDIRRIFSLGYFNDVSSKVEKAPGGVVVTFIVEEKPTISEIQIKGSRSLSLKKIRKLLGIAAGEQYDPRKVKEAVAKLKAEYFRKGFSEVEVLTQVSDDADGRSMILRFLIEEGGKLRVRDILIEGNIAYSDRKVLKLLKTKRKGWFRKGIFSEQVMQEDLERIRVFYRKKGYQDISVRSNVYQNPEGKGLIVHLSMEEGIQHRVGGIQLEGNVLFPEHEMRQLLVLKPGAIYNRGGLQADLAAIKQYYGDRGYINAEVTPDTRFDPSSKRVDLTYHIIENELVYLNRINIQGNLRTKDVVIRRELRIYPGEPFDGEAIRKSVDRLYNLGFFEEVTVDTDPTQTPNHEDLLVKVKETKTGSFSFGGGFSSVDRVVGLIELEQRNFDWRSFPKFTGAGQDLRFRIQLGSVRRFFDLSFTEPWIFGKPYLFGIDIYDRTRLRSQNLGFGFEEKRRGVGLRFGKEFNDIVNVGLGYQLYRIDISDVAAEASADLKAEQGRSDVSAIGINIGMDKRNNRFDPTDGLFLYSSADLAGGVLAGDQEFYRLQGGASYYWPHKDRFVLESRLRAGIVNEYSDTQEVPIFERFFAGGSNSIRGFKERRVGPLDPVTNDPVGGEATLLTTLEEVMTIVNDERGRPILKATVFLDIGNVWDQVDDFAEDFKVGAGFGTRINTPIGPVRLDLGVPISGLGDDKRKARFHFNVSRSF